MRRKTELPELLAPAGSFECLLAAAEAGADAVYVGGKRFGARAYAKNFDTEELKRAVDYCHLCGVKIYVTLNTLILDKEMEDAVAYAKELYKMGVDALIIADIGAIAEIRRCVPKLALHASTQMSLHSSEGVKMAESLGCERAVVARELSYSDIKTAVESTGIEIETFLHGALCVSHSGQCLFSSLVGGRSGNRGECAQPCRLPYNNRYPLSLSDLSLSEHITELIESGVSSLKIEGRMKSADYVFGVTSIYRHLLNERRNANSKEREELKRLFSRSGFTDGYFTGKIKEPMTGVRSEEEKRASRESVGKKYEIIRTRVAARAEIRLGIPSSLTLIGGNKTVTVYGESAAPAENSPLTEESVKERLSKMGNTLLSLEAEDIELILDEGVNLSPSAINALRREAAKRFEDSSREYEDIPYVKERQRHSYKKLDTALFFDEKCFERLSQRLDLTTKLDIIFIPLFSSEENLKKAGGVYLPPVILDSERGDIEKAAKRAAFHGVKYALVGNLGALSISKESGLVPIGDFRLNVTNGSTAEYYRKQGVEHIILSPELTLPMARDIGGAIISYGRIPLMITERCFMKENFGCKNCSGCAFTDRFSEKFPIIREYPHRNLILNSRPTYIGDRQDELNKYSISSRHFLFTTEKEGEALRALEAFYKGESLGEGVRRVGKRKNNKK